MYMGNLSYWNHKFEARSQKLMQPEDRLVNDMPSLPKSGSVLELACGDGRNAIFLAAHGYKVTAVDFSNIAIERLNQFVAQKRLHISALQKDLCIEESYYDLGEFDLIIINHYRLENRFYPVLEQHLKENGVLWVNGFCEVPKDHPDMKQEDMIAPADLNELRQLTCESTTNYAVGTRKFIRYIWRKLA